MYKFCDPLAGHHEEDIQLAYGCEIGSIFKNVQDSAAMGGQQSGRVFSLAAPSTEVGRHQAPGIMAAE